MLPRSDQCCCHTATADIKGRRQRNAADHILSSQVKMIFSSLILSKLNPSLTIFKHLAQLHQTFILYNLHHVSIHLNMYILYIWCHDFDPKSKIDGNERSISAFKIKGRMVILLVFFSLHPHLLASEEKKNFKDEAV